MLTSFDTKNHIGWISDSPCKSIEFFYLTIYLDLVENAKKIATPEELRQITMYTINKQFPGED